MSRFANAVLWLLLALGIALVVVMTWHPWVHPWTGVRT
ncbi:MAG: hypothetical protein JWM87_1774 [Candidatus Eremiobacteraeota bacterium]|nr:hypothetical protein [Candidatus Eremiobacteraeota bacterium]